MAFDFQNIIQRFANQSFGVKALSLTFLALVYSSYLEYFSNKNAILLIICIVIFMILDSFYLKMERTYINIESQCFENNENFKGYNYREYTTKKISLLKVVFSKTIIPIYLVQLIIVLIPVIEISVERIG